MKLLTPEENWIQYRNFVYNIDLAVGDEQERQRAFYAGSEAVFKLLESLDGMPIHKTIEPLQGYREANKQAAMETISPEDRLIAEIERKSALGEIE